QIGSWRFEMRGSKRAIHRRLQASEFETCGIESSRCEMHLREKWRRGNRDVKFLRAKAIWLATDETNWVSFMIKLLRAYGECLGARRRRRTWQAAISLGEPQAGFDPRISEWGNPAR